MFSSLQNIMSGEGSTLLWSCQG